MAYIPWWNRTGPITLGERFELNEISTRAKTLSPTKSYAQKPYNWEEGDWWDLDDQSVGNTKILEDFEITEEMKRRPNVDGGRIGLQGGLLAKAQKIPEYIKTAQKVWNTGKQVFNSFKNLRRTDALKDADVNEVRSAINTAVKEDLGLGLSVTKVTKSGDVIYQLARTGEKSKYSKDLAPLILERNTWVADKIKPLANKGFISGKDFNKILTDKGISYKADPSTVLNKRGISQQMSKIADSHGIEKVQSPFGGSNFWYKNPSPEKLESIYKLRLKPEERVTIAKDFIKRFELTSFNKLNKVMKDQGYNMFKLPELNKYFPEIKGIAYTDPNFVAYGKTFTPTSTLNSIKYHLKKAMTGEKTEKFIVAAKKETGLGKKSELMHTQPKRKLSGELLDWNDLRFGSAAENEAYANGLEMIRKNFSDVLISVSKKHNGKNMNAIIETAPILRRDYGFPNKMTVKEYVSRINNGLVDLASKTGGSVRGDILNIVGNKMKFTPNTVGIEYSKVPGWGMLEGNLKKYEKTFRKVKIDENGNLAVKKGYKLSDKEARDIFVVWKNLPEQVRKSLTTKAFTGKLEFAEGGRTGFDAGTLVTEEVSVKPSKLKEVAKKYVGKPFTKLIAGATLPGWHIPETVKAIKEKRLPDYDLTDPNTWMHAAFWNWAVKEWGVTKTLDQFSKANIPGKAKILSHVVARGGLSPNLVKFISSRVAWPLTGIMSVHDAYEDYQRRKPFIEEQKELIEQGVVKEEEFDKEEPMFAMGGIASLIK